MLMLLVYVGWRMVRGRLHRLVVGCLSLRLLRSWILPTRLDRRALLVLRKTLHTRLGCVNIRGVRRKVLPVRLSQPSLCMLWREMLHIGWGRLSMYRWWRAIIHVRLRVSGMRHALADEIARRIGLYGRV